MARTCVHPRPYRAGMASALAITPRLTTPLPRPKGITGVLPALAEARMTCTSSIVFGPGDTGLEAGRRAGRPGRARG